MKKRWVGILGVLCCTAGSLCADGYSPEDQDLLAGKGIFPGGGDEEGALPQAGMTEDDSDDDSDNFQRRSPYNQPGNTNSEQRINPEVNSRNPSADKGVFPPEESSDNPSTGKDIFPPSESSENPSAGKGIFPPEESSDEQDY